MNGHGGARVGAGRKPTNKPTTKVNIYIEDRELINNYAKSLGISVNELLHRVFTNDSFENYLNNIKQF